MTWSDGYVVDVEYTAGFFGILDLGRLGSVCVINGFEPVDTDEPFTYFELGCGHGFTVTMLAAANPQGSFYAADFMPAHIAAGRQLAAQARLETSGCWKTASPNWLQATSRCRRWTSSRCTACTHGSLKRAAGTSSTSLPATSNPAASCS